MCFVQFIDKVYVQKCFSGLDLNQKGEALTGLRSVGLGSTYTWFECSFKPMLIPYGWSILAKQRDPNWSPYDFT